MVWDKELWDHQIEYSWSWEGHDCLDQILCHLIQKLVKSHLKKTRSFKIQSFQIVDIFQTGLKYCW